MLSILWSSGKRMAVVNWWGKLIEIELYERDLKIQYNLKGVIIFVNKIFISDWWWISYIPIINSTELSLHWLYIEKKDHEKRNYVKGVHIECRWNAWKHFEFVLKSIFNGEAHAEKGKKSTTTTVNVFVHVVTFLWFFFPILIR